MRAIASQRRTERREGGVEKAGIEGSTVTKGGAEAMTEEEVEAEAIPEE